METYDRILKWTDEEESCVTCHLTDTCPGFKKSFCVRLRPDLMDEMWNYANADQLKGLIKESESGAHQWVRDNGQFVCKIKECPKEKACRYKKPQASKNITCSYSDEEGWIMVPYRGNKTEELTWPGRSDEDCSEVELFVCGNSKCPNKLCNNKPAAEKEWKESGCVHISLVSVNTGSVKEDRSDTEYNQGKEFLKGKAVEMKEGVVEYVAAKDITLESLAHDIKMTPELFIWIFRKQRNIAYAAGQDIHSTSQICLKAKELIRLGLIERKVDDPDVQMGDCFKTGEVIVRATFAGPWQITLTTVVGGTPGAGFNGKISDVTEIKKYDCKLSELVGKNRLKDFRPVKVKSEVVDE